MSSPVRTVPGVGAVRSGSGALPDPAGSRHGGGAQAAPDESAAAAPATDLVDLSRETDSLDTVVLLGQRKAAELQLNPRRLLAMMSRKG
ncbi:MAG TPA: hypothetical protein VMT21_04000 [Gemmatimonadales bacterium]|nr:hypothetical protein [Gemmatimonadales bacterium]